MFKSIRTKLNKKGFTLAELLVVVAIIAILVAIAIPIFTGALRDAQWRTNQANVRSVKAAAVTKILTNWAGKADVGDDKMAVGATDEKSGWVVTAEVDGQGNIDHLTIDARGDLSGFPEPLGDAIAAGAPGGASAQETNDSTIWKEVNGEEGKLISLTNGNVYWVRVIIKSTDIKGASGAAAG